DLEPKPVSEAVVEEVNEAEGGPYERDRLARFLELSEAPGQRFESKPGSVDEIFRLAQAVILDEVRHPARDRQGRSRSLGRDEQQRAMAHAVGEQEPSARRLGSQVPEPEPHLVEVDERRLGLAR